MKKLLVVLGLSALLVAPALAQRQPRSEARNPSTVVKKDLGATDPIKAKEAKTKKAKDEVNQAEKDRIAERQATCDSEWKAKHPQCKPSMFNPCYAPPKVDVKKVMEGQKQPPPESYSAFMYRCTHP